jgi:hypothetical protein
MCGLRVVFVEGNQGVTGGSSLDAQITDLTIGTKVEQKLGVYIGC